MALFKKKDLKEQFLAAVKKVLRRLGVDGPIEYDEDLFAFRISGERTIMLGNLFGRWRSLSKADAGAYLARVEPAAHRPRPASDARRAEWFAVDDLPQLAFDHGKILETALARLES